MFKSNAAIGRAIEALARCEARKYEDWLSTEAARLLPPDVFLRAYGNDECKRDVAAQLESMGFYVAIYPDGLTQLRKGDEVVSTYEPA